MAHLSRHKTLLLAIATTSEQLKIGDDRYQRSWIGTLFIQVMA